MEYPVILLSLGVILLLVGLVGKVKAQQLEVGTNNKVIRIIVGCLGTIFIILSLYMFFSVSSTPTTKEKSFYKPIIDDYRLDWCYGYSSGCGKLAADEFCSQQGYDEASEYAVERQVGTQGVITKAIGSGELCNRDVCDSFEIITCK